VPIHRRMLLVGGARCVERGGPWPRWYRVADSHHARLDRLLKDPLDCAAPHPLPNPGQARMIRQSLVQAVACEPTDRQITWLRASADDRG
jgi:hypothetical protein